MASEENEKVASGRNGRAYVGEAAVRLVNLLYDTDEERLLGLTRLNSSREILMLSIQVAKESALDPVRIKARIPLSKVWRHAFLTGRRSLDMKAFMLGVGLAQGQAEAEEQQPSEESDMI